MSKRRLANGSSDSHTLIVWKKQSIGMTIVAIVLTLSAYQFAHHGLWGTLVNYNKTPKLVLSGSAIHKGALQLAVYRPDGPDTYGSFIVTITITGDHSAIPAEVWGPKQLAHINARAIHNTYYFQRVVKGPWGLIVPLSARAHIDLSLSQTAQAQLRTTRRATLSVEDVSGLKWQTVVPTHP